MSKLDDILQQSARVIAEGVVTDNWSPVDTKAQIKALYLELIGYGSVDMEYDMGKLTLQEKAELVGRNQLTTELRQKVEEL